VKTNKHHLYLKEVSRQENWEVISFWLFFLREKLTSISWSINRLKKKN